MDSFKNAQEWESLDMTVDFIQKKVQNFLSKLMHPLFYTWTRIYVFWIKRCKMNRIQIIFKFYLNVLDQWNPFLYLSPILALHPVSPTAPFSPFFPYWMARMPHYTQAFLHEWVCFPAHCPHSEAEGWR